MALYWRVASFLIGFIVPLTYAQSFTGVLYPKEERVLSFGSTGVVSTVAVKLGQAVAKGDLLMALDDRRESLEVQRRQALADDTFELVALEAQIETLIEQENSARELYDNAGVVSLDELRGLTNERIASQARIDQLRAEVGRLQLELQMAQVELDFRLLKAPTAGVITQIARDEGEWANQGEPVAELVNTEKLSLQISVSSDAAAELDGDQSIDVEIESGLVLPGTIEYIAPVADASSGLVELRVLVDNADGLAFPGTQGTLSVGDSASRL